MTYPLLSPGTSVTITDESMYASASAGTVPLFIIGTHENKALPDGSGGVAPGTLAANANVLYPITSQRELLQTFGNPIFYTKNGTSVHGYELNEYGLHAAYQYLGIATNAFVIRGDIDYAQLIPSATAPTAEPANGTNWFNTSNNTWNFYEYSGSDWIERSLWVVQSTVNLDTTSPEVISGQQLPLISGAANGDLAITVINPDGTTSPVKVLYQLLAGTWHVVGTTAWATAKGGSPSLVYNTYQPSTSNVGDILVLITPNVVTSLSSAATWLLNTFNSTTGAWTSTMVPVYSIDRESSLAKTSGSVYLSYQDTQAVFEFRTYNGSAWVALTEISSSTAPTAAPADGTLWYNNLNLVVNIKVSHNGAWVPYNQYYPNTDVNGVILLGSQPTAQSTGAPLVANDLWLNTSDTENWPMLYRYSAGAWVAVNTTNSIDPINGIAFGEAATTTALNYAEGMKLYDLAASTNDVKQYVAATNTWTNISGYQLNGVPYFGRKAQRALIVKALAATIESNQDIRSETVYFNLIAAPGYIELLGDMVTLNTDMNEVAFVVADTPIRLASDSASITAFATNNSNGDTESGVSTFDANVGMYYPWGLTTNVDGNEIMIPPSAIALCTIAYSDSVSYQWMAPAGFTRGLVNNATSVGYLDSSGNFKAAMLNSGQRDTLYTNDINPIAYIPNRGLVVYGQKTRSSTSSALDRINVARLIGYLRYNLDNLSKPFLFEPNDAQTRDSVQTTFNRFMSNLVGLRGLYDYVVVCDESNNTSTTIDNNELWIDIAIQPEKAIEFIYIPVRIVNTGTDLGTVFSSSSTSA